MDIDITTLFATVAGFAAGAVAVTQAVKAWLQNITHNELKSWVKWTISFIVGIGLSMGGWGFHIGCFADMTWYIALGTGILTALASEGLYDSTLVQWILSLFGYSAFKRKPVEGTSLGIAATAGSMAEAAGTATAGGNSSGKPTFEDVFRAMLMGGDLNPTSMKSLMSRYGLVAYMRPKYAVITGSGTNLVSTIRFWKIRMRCLTNVANIEEVKTNSDGTQQTVRYIAVRIDTFEDWCNLETCVEKIAWGNLSPTEEVSDGEAVKEGIDA